MIVEKGHTSMPVGRDTIITRTQALPMVQQDQLLELPRSVAYPSPGGAGYRTFYNQLHTALDGKTPKRWTATA